MLRTTAQFVFSIFVAIALMALPPVSYSHVAFGISVSFAPPDLPYYDQPPCPAEGYIWTPGYWAYDYDEEDYYWVPGTWVSAPRPGYLWTPAYWAWDNDVYVFHAGYWGEHIGFYGGVNYGYGYSGYGYDGGYWDGGVFNYNTAVNNVNTTVITNVYNRTVINNNVTVNNVSYNGGHGGIAAQPTAAELVAARERHVPSTNFQANHQYTAKNNPSKYLRVNAGRPAVAATPKPGVFQGRGVVAAARVSRTPQSDRRPTSANAVNNRPANAMNGKTATTNSADRRTTAATRSGHSPLAPRPVDNNIYRRNSDRPPSAQRSMANNSNRPNQINTDSGKNYSAVSPADRPMSARRNLSSTTAPSRGSFNANGQSSRATTNRPYSPQRNNRFASQQRNDRPALARPDERFASSQRNHPSSSLQPNDRFASRQYNGSAKADNSYRAPSSRPSSSDVRNRSYEPLPQRQSPAQFQHPVPQRQGVPPLQRQSSAPRQSAAQFQHPAPQRQSVPPPQRQSAPQNVNRATPPPKDHPPSHPR
jgi:hypothetical protein